MFNKILEEVCCVIVFNGDVYFDIFVVYGDCGIGGFLDKVLEEIGVWWIEGVYCYVFFLGLEMFDQFEEDQFGSFYLIDFFVWYF